jgi:hypothetical protein
MSATQTAVSVISGTVLAVAVIGSATVGLVTGHLDSAAYQGVVSAVIAGTAVVGGGAVVGTHINRAITTTSTAVPTVATTGVTETV